MMIVVTQRELLGSWQRFPTVVLVVKCAIASTDSSIAWMLLLPRGQGEELQMVVWWKNNEGGQEGEQGCAGTLANADRIF
jgi:hypothetical protein